MNSSHFDRETDNRAELGCIDPFWVLWSSLGFETASKVAKIGMNLWVDKVIHIWHYCVNPPCRFDGRAPGRSRAARHSFLGKFVITNAYIDGFNLYYGCYRYHPTNQRAKWLDLRALCAALLANDQIHRVHYFTAMVKAEWDPSAPLRQETYVRALRGCPNLYVHLGKFQAVERKGVPSHLPPGSPVVKISTWEEKGSDVNLATKLLTDAMDGDFEQALVVSNDSDLLEPIKVVRQKFGLPLVVVSPKDGVTTKLRRAASASFVLDHALLAQCQLPNPARDKQGRLVTKPMVW
jgi:NYN domain